MSDKDRINDNTLDKISGGVIFDATDIIGSDPYNPWEVLDDKDGHVVARFPNKWAAQMSVGALNENHVEVTWEQVLQLRGQA